MTTATAMKIAAANEITVDAADAIADAYAEASGAWAALGWDYIAGCGDGCFDVPAGTTAAQAETEAETATAEDVAAAWRRAGVAIEQITNLAACAEREAADAIAHAVAGDLDSAHASAEEACRSERKAGGDAPTWHPLVVALGTALRQAEEANEAAEESE